MKKYIYTFIGLLIGVIGFLIISELTYSPLKEKDFKMLFPNYNDSAEKKCSIGFLGWSPEGAVFDLYVYQLDKMPIDSMFPDFKSGLGNVDMLDGTIYSKWVKCPIDSLAHLKYEFTLTTKDFNTEKCSHSFNKDLQNSNNYYSYVYVNELEQYFFLYCPSEGQLYYIRRRGF